MKQNYYTGQIRETVCYVTEECLQSGQFDEVRYLKQNLDTFNMLANKQATAPLLPALPLQKASVSEIKAALKKEYQPCN